MFNNFIKKKKNIVIEIGKNPQDDLELLLIECKKQLNSFNEEKIKKAFMMCYEAHDNKLRLSGLPYYTHPLEVALILIKEIPLDDISLMAALLHDVLDDGDKYTIKDIEIEFGPEVSNIVEGIHKIGHIENKNIDKFTQIENYRKLLLSLFKDVRIILIKLADRLHNMRTIQYLPESSRLKLAKETIDIYAPFANRFGLHNIKWELEDLSFKETNTKAYDEIKSQLKSTREQRQTYIDNFISSLYEILSKDELIKKLKVKYEIIGRAKHIYSIYNKMIARKKEMSELYDIIAVRVILDTTENNICFYTYGLIASYFAPAPDTFKDYINSPKRNGYQSLHCALVGPLKKMIEIQIRTKKMHDYAEEGFAAHFRYKGGNVNPSSILEEKQINDWMNAVREIFENAGFNTSEELLDSVKKNIFFDEIFVYTPKNEFRTLPKDSTPLDFAFDIHTEIGYHYIGAKVNSRIVPIDYKLMSGDQVEILTSKKQTPKAEWLKYVVTSKAKSIINKFIKEEEKELETKGQEIWEEKIKNFDFQISQEEFDKLLKIFKFANSKKFFIAIATTKFDINQADDYIRYKLKEEIKLNEIQNNPEDNQDQIESRKIYDKVYNYNDEYLKKLEDNKIQIYLKIIAKDIPKISEIINTSLIATKGISLQSVRFVDNDNYFIELINLKVKDESIIKIILENLFIINEIIKIEFLKNIIEE